MNKKVPDRPKSSVVHMVASPPEQSSKKRQIRVDTPSYIYETYNVVKTPNVDTRDPEKLTLNVD